MIISFGYTSQYLPPHGPKRVTRRNWSKKHQESWCRAWDRNPHALHPAWDKSPQFGGKCIGHIVLAARPYQEDIMDMPLMDLLHEGGMVATLNEFRETYFPDPQSLKAGPGIVTVVRFNFTPLGGSSDQD